MHYILINGRRNNNITPTLNPYTMPAKRSELNKRRREYYAECVFYFIVFIACPYPVLCSSNLEDERRRAREYVQRYVYSQYL